MPPVKSPKRAARYVVGIDEVGRGPLAGPLVVGVVLIKRGVRLDRSKLRDSKRLTEKARNEWAEKIRSHTRISYALAEVAPKVVDRLNVSRAANQAALRAFTRLAASHQLQKEDCEIYLDGSLYLGNGASRLAAQTVIKGDEKIPAVALASIVAKVHRDSIMTRYASRFPGYGFERHKGYGTAAHLEALRKLGPTQVHRLTFLGKSNIIGRKQPHGRRTNKTSYTR